MAELKPIPPTHGGKPNPATPPPPAPAAPVYAAPVPAQPQPDEVKVPMGGVAEALREGKTTFAGKRGIEQKS
jgi:hypothetical protein